MHMIYVSLLALPSLLCRTYFEPWSIIISETLTVFVQCYGQYTILHKISWLFISCLLKTKKITKLAIFHIKTMILKIFSFRALQLYQVEYEVFP